MSKIRFNKEWTLRDRWIVAQNITPFSDAASEQANGNSDVDRQSMMSPEARHENSMLTALLRLENEPGLYDKNCSRPSPYAFVRLRDLLTQTAYCMRSVFPPGTVYPDGSGALRAEWHQLNREVTLVVFSGAEDQHYIFHKEDKSYAGNYNVTPERLCFYLDWLNNNEPAAN